MKKTVLNMAILLCTGLLVSCGSSGTKEESKTEDTNTTTQAVSPEPTPVAQTEKQKMPTCYIKKGTPLTDSMITVHVRCKNGNIPIDEATVTLDGTVKDVAYKGVYFSDYIGFRNLQPDTSYKATLEVLVGGKTIKKSVKIRTREEKVLATPTPTPTPIVDTPPSNNSPKWTKNFYDTNIIYKNKDVDTDKVILDLTKVCKSEKGSKIDFSILGVELNSGGKPYDDIVKIEDGILKVDVLTSFLYGSKGSVIITISAKIKEGNSNSKIKFTYDLTPFEVPEK